MNDTTSAPEPRTNHNGFPPDAFSRLDESPDSLFYARDRFVSHLDSLALSTVRRIIGRLVVEDSPTILDLMAGWDSHLPETMHPSRTVGLGLNPNELAANQRLTEWVLHDLNMDPSLPFPSDTFDVVLNTVSVDYLVKPREVFAEVNRVLKPRGLFLVIFSNRMFPEKATRIWKNSTEEERLRLVMDFFRTTPGFLEPRHFESSGKPRPSDDKYAHLGIPSDPVFAVYAEKEGSSSGRRERPAPEQLEEEPPAACATPAERVAGEWRTCPHCGSGLKKWRFPVSPFSNWDIEFVYICFNDSCPYLLRGWAVMRAQGNSGTSYRYAYEPVRKTPLVLPIHTLHDLKNGIVEES